MFSIESEIHTVTYREAKSSFGASAMEGPLDELREDDLDLEE